MWGNFDETVQGGQGGFLNDSRGASSAGGEKGVKRAQNIVPVMIRHMTNCVSNLELWGSPVRIVTFVGIIRKIEHATTKMTFEIEDDTDKIMAYRWLEADNSVKEPEYTVNNYVRVYGHLREQNNIKHVLILRIMPIRTLNELTSHLLEVTYVTVQAEKMKKGKETSNMETTDDFNMDDNVNGLTKEQMVVFKIIQEENDTENGIERHTLKARVSKNVLPNVDKIIDFLTSEGHIYTTRTDDHFKTT